MLIFLDLRPSLGTSIGLKIYSCTLILYTKIKTCAIMEREARTGQERRMRATERNKYAREEDNAQPNAMYVAAFTNG